MSNNKVLISAQQIGMTEVTYRKTEIELKDLLYPDKVVTVPHGVLKVIMSTLRANGTAEAARENSGAGKEVQKEKA